MNLLFLRHGEALDGSLYQDSERPLSTRGTQQAATVGRFLREQAIHPGLILCSPLVRARQTAEEVQREVGATPVQTTECLTSSSDPHAILLELRMLGQETVLMIGHEPHLSKTISVLLGVDTRSRVEMKTCCLAYVVTTAEPAPGAGILRWLIPSNVTLGEHSR
jgi:phosphohistidine phosphatase